ncbi:hypothetical protein LTR56_011115 [Elasticomyces elasticus]|nr:hypothetical protein LTR56_011115 [Elasticomyces elasticus]KAK3662464.1 hypothetical protein LTR22_006743 [Elasticomyces elasticus]KAK4926453.1 hypothetical protein LTR49_006660 [Elasticomyces elasticus]KAK5761173.1 hypothetical protein LTS12_008654 [Elasticomyces elasticus]
MASPGALTKSSMLYEGNYAEWESRMEAMLEMHQIEGVWRPHANNLLQVFSRLLTRQQTRRVAALIADQVSIALLQRIPTARQEDPNNLLYDLQHVAQPFPINKLPPELRQRIYGFHFGKSARYLISIGGYKQNTPPSNLLRVSRDVFTEALPLFFEMAEICFAVRRPFTPALQASAEQTVREWVNGCAKANVKYLRRVTLRLGRYGTPHEIRVNLHSENGLEVQFSSDIPVKQQKGWEEHIRKLEENRRVLGLQGEALILALTGKAELWQR